MSANVTCANSSPELTALAAASAPTSRAASGETVLAWSRRLRAGDESAWRTLHERYCDRLWRYLLVLTHGQEDAASEALQLTFVRAARHMKAFDSEAALWGWLTVLARSVAVDEHRKRRRYAAFLERFLVWRRTAAPDPALESNPETEWEAALRRGLAQLLDKDRWLIEQKHLAGRRVKDLATEAGETEKSVESRLGRVRRKLKDLIAKELQHDAGVD